LFGMLLNMEPNNNRNHKESQLYEKSTLSESSRKKSYVTTVFLTILVWVIIGILFYFSNVFMAIFGLSDCLTTGCGKL
jgi:Ca2+/Na+ antiporter